MRIKDKKKFFRFLLLLFIFIFTVSCGVKRMIFNDEEVTTTEKKNVEMVHDEIKIDVSRGETEKLANSQLLAVAKEVTENEEAVTPLEATSVDRYIKNNSLFVYSDEAQTKKIDTLRKSTRFKVIKIKEVNLKNKKKSVAYIEYKKDLKNKKGWISNIDFGKSLNDTLPTSWKNLDFKTNVKRENYLSNPRKKVKGIYLNIYTISSQKKMERLIKLANTTEINAFVIDIKDDNGNLSFEMQAPKKYGIPVNKNYPIKNIDTFMKRLKENNIYTIARIVSFKDPTYAKANPDKVIINRANGKPYTNSDGIIWVSAHDRNLWNYNIEVAKEAAKVGFNEIQFDYVRFPASNGGKLDTQLDYRNYKKESKPETIQKYLKYAKSELEEEKVYLSADVYGQVGTFKDDMGLGQHWETISKVVDYICPMMYPSHYGNGAYGIEVPDAQPYKTIYSSVRDSVNRNYNIDNGAQIRPWLQAFSAPWVKGHINYNEAEIRAQIKALNDLKIDEYLLWSPSNNYKITK